MSHKLHPTLKDTVNKALIRGAVAGIVPDTEGRIIVDGRVVKTTAKNKAKAVPSQPRRPRRFRAGRELSATEKRDDIIACKRNWPKARMVDELRTALTTIEFREPVSTTAWARITELATLGFLRDGGTHAELADLQHTVLSELHANRKNHQ